MSQIHRTQSDHVRFDLLSRKTYGFGKGDAIVRVGERKGELFFFFFVRPPRTVLRLTFCVSFISDEPDYNQTGSISPQKTTPGGQSHYSGRVVSVKQSAC